MENITKTALELVFMDTMNKLGSNCKGRRNYVIKIEHSDNVKYAYVGGFGVMCNRGMMSALIKNIVKYRIRWFEFTYKKDLLKALKILEEAGYSIRWIS